MANKKQLLIHGEDMAIVSLAWFRSGLRDNGLGVALAVASFMDNESGHAFVSQKKIASLLDIRSNNVPRAIDRAIEAGVLAKLSQGRSVTGRTNEYMVFATPDPERAQLITALQKDNTSILRDKEGWKAREYFDWLRRVPIEELEERLTSEHSEEKLTSEQPMTHQRATNDSPVSKERLTSDVPTTLGTTPSSTLITTLEDASAEDTISSSLADDDSAQVADRVAACGTALLLSDDDVFSSVGRLDECLHSHNPSALQPSYVATNNSGDSYRDPDSDIDEEVEDNWSNGTDSFDDPSQYRTYRDIPPPTSTYGNIPDKGSLWDRLNA